MIIVSMVFIVVLLFSIAIVFIGITIINTASLVPIIYITVTHIIFVITVFSEIFSLVLLVSFITAIVIIIMTKIIILQFVYK